MKTTQLRAEEGQSTRTADANAPRASGDDHQPTENIDDVLRQIIRDELAVGDEE